jgi:hypothetical protein
MTALALELPLGIPTPKPRMPAPPIVRSAQIEGPYRWTMTRAWGAGPTILWNLFNASDADGKRDDPTTLRMMGFSYRWGFGSMIVVNVYPFIASKPADLHAWRRTFDHKTYEANGMLPWELDQSSWSAFHHNQSVISDLLTPDMTCVAAWGLGPDEADLQHFLYGVRINVDTSEHDGFGIVGVAPTWHCLGTNADGSPIHPLARGRNRVPDTAKLKKWNPKPSVPGQPGERT